MDNKHISKKRLLEEVLSVLDTYEYPLFWPKEVREKVELKLNCSLSDRQAECNQVVFEYAQACQNGLEALGCESHFDLSQTDLKKNSCNVSEAKIAKESKSSPSVKSSSKRQQNSMDSDVSKVQIPKGRKSTTSRKLSRKRQQESMDTDYSKVNIAKESKSLSPSKLSRKRQRGSMDFDYSEVNIAKESKSSPSRKLLRKRKRDTSDSDDSEVKLVKVRKSTPSRRLSRKSNIDSADLMLHDADVQPPPAKKRRIEETDEEDEDELLNSYKLSPDLANLLGDEYLPRNEIIKRIWVIVKERNLIDPKNNQYAICDEELKKVMKVKRFHIFNMMKYLKSHLMS